MFSLGLSCCSMPPKAEIASVWRKSLEKLKNFLHLVDTGVVGFVHNQQQQPLRESFIRLLEHNQVYNVSKNEARFQLILPEGSYNLEISAPNYESLTTRVEVQNGNISELGAIKLSPYSLVTGRSEIISLGNLDKDSAIITGFVLDNSNHPIKHAKVSVVKPSKMDYVRNFTDSTGAYTLRNVPDGIITLKAEAPRYFEANKIVKIDASTNELKKNVVLNLQRNTHIMGMPRFVFIVLASLIIIIVVILCIICAQFLLGRRHRTDKPYYNFSLLPQKGKELFEDDGDDGETELFRSPIKSK